MRIESVYKIVCYDHIKNLIYIDIRDVKSIVQIDRFQFVPLTMMHVIDGILNVRTVDKYIK